MRKLFHNRIFRAGLLALSLSVSAPVWAQPLSGSYTINAALSPGGTNFTSFTDAVSALSANGISDAVVFDVAADTYDEQVIIPSISGSSATHTITFNAEGATLQYTSVNTGQRAVLKLDGADYITFNGLLIAGTGNTASQYGYGIQLMNGADHNYILGCKISVSMASSASIINNFAGILVNSVADNVSSQGNTNCHFNHIEGNTVIGGYYGIALVANGSTDMINGNEIKNNSIQDFFRAGVYLDGNNGTLVTDNDISRPNINSGLFWGISLFNGNTEVQVTGNRIHDPFGNTGTNSGAFGFYLYNAAAGANHENIFANNLIYNFKSTGITDGADLSSNCNYNKFIHNTIVLNDQGASGFTQARGFSLNGALTGITITNNLIYISRTTQGGKHCIYASAAPSGSKIDNNDLVMAAAGGLVPSGIGYFSNGNRVSLSDWQTASGFDAASVNEDPLFANAGAGEFNPLNTALQAGLPVELTGVAADIDGMGRNTTVPPTIGAYEINGIVLPVQLSALSGRVTASGAAQLKWDTYSENNNKGFAVMKSTDGASWQQAGYIATAAENGNSAATIRYTFDDPVRISGTVYYRLLQTDLDGKAQYSNIVALHVGKAISNGSFAVYPNPATGRIFLQSAAEQDEEDITVTDLQGKIVLHTKAAAAGIDISALIPGMYAVTVSGKDGAQQARFIKIR